MIMKEWRLKDEKRDSWQMLRNQKKTVLGILISDKLDHKSQMDERVTI